MAANKGNEGINYKRMTFSLQMETAEKIDAIAAQTRFKKTVLVDEAINLLYKHYIEKGYIEDSSEES